MMQESQGLSPRGSKERRVCPHWNQEAGCQDVGVAGAVWFDFKHGFWYHSQAFWG